MLFKRCAFCHKLVFFPFFNAHREKHTTRRSDGQLTDHITVQPKDRYQGSLRRVPQVYRHPECGVETRMPEDIVRSYLANPFLHSDMTFCCGCGDYVSQTDVFWSETGECLADYFHTLQAEYVKTHGKPPRKKGH